VFLGYITVPTTGLWGVKLASDGYARFWIGDKAFGYAKSDSLYWSDSDGPNGKAFTMFLVAGESYPFRIHHGNSVGCDDLVLSFRKPGTYTYSVDGVTFSRPLSSDTRWSLPLLRTASALQKRQQDSAPLTGSSVGMNYYLFADFPSACKLILLNISDRYTI
jgi:hypothetical protein